MDAESRLLINLSRLKVLRNMSCCSCVAAGSVSRSSISYAEIARSSARKARAWLGLESFWSGGMPTKPHSLLLRCMETSLLRSKMSACQVSSPALFWKSFCLMSRICAEPALHSNGAQENAKNECDFIQDLDVYRFPSPLNSSCCTGGHCRDLQTIHSSIFQPAVWGERFCLKLE